MGNIATEPVQENVTVTVGHRTYAIGRMYVPIAWELSDTLADFLHEVADEISKNVWLNEE